MQKRATTLRVQDNYKKQQWCNYLTLDVIFLKHFFLL